MSGFVLMVIGFVLVGFSEPVTVMEAPGLFFGGMAFAAGIGLFVSWFVSMPEGLLKLELNDRHVIKHINQEMTVSIEDGEVTTLRAGFKSVMPLDGFHKHELPSGAILLHDPGARASVTLRREYFENEESWRGLQAVLENVPRLLPEPVRKQKHNN